MCARRRRALLFRLIALLLVASVTSYALAREPLPIDLTFERRSIDGVDMQYVTQVAQAERYLWFATERGLVRYDGTHTRTFQHEPEDDGSLSDNRVESLYVDQAGVLWVMPGSVLHRYDAQRERFDNVGARASLAFEDAAGRFWLAGHQTGLQRFSRRTGRVEAVYSPGVAPASFSSIAQLGEMLLLADGVSLYAFDPELAGTRQAGEGGARAFSEVTRFRGKQVSEVMVDSRGYVWTGSVRGGLYDAYRGDETLAVPAAYRDWRVNALYEDAAGDVWIGTDENGVLRFAARTSTFIHYGADPENAFALGYGAVFDITQTHSTQTPGGSLWFIVNRDGAYQLNPHRQAFTPVHPVLFGGSELDYLLTRLVAARDGTLWLGTDGGGVYHFEPDGRLLGRYLAEDVPPSARKVIGLAEDAQGHIWAGTWGGGVYRINPAARAAQAFTPGAPFEDWLKITSEVFYSDVSGALWFAVPPQGLLRYDPAAGTWQRFFASGEAETRLVDGYVTAFLETRSHVWIGGYNGLERFDRASGRRAHFTAPSAETDAPGASLTSNYITDLLEDSRGVLWAATDAGLNRYDASSETFVPVTRADAEGSDAEGSDVGDAGPDPLLNVAVSGVEEDSSGVLWIATDTGLVRYAPRDAASAAINVFAEDEGLRSTAFSRRTHAPLGDTLLFGGRNGLYRYEASRVRPYTSAPEVVLENLYLDNQRAAVAAAPLAGTALSQLETLTLEPHQSRFSLSFTAPDFTSDTVAYSYRLQGLVDAWQPALPGTQLATYTDLSPGDLRRPSSCTSRPRGGRP